MSKKLLTTMLLALAVAAIAIGLPGMAGADDAAPPTATTTAPAPVPDPVAPAHFYEKTYRMNVNLQDVAGTVYSATLSSLPPSVPWPAQQWINYSLDTGTFDIASKDARCFVIGAKTATVPCSTIAKMVDESSDGGVDASVLVQPVDGGADGMSFTAKKITVWVDSSGNDVAPPADGGSPGGDTTPPPVPPKFYSKNIRLNVNLQDAAAGPLFDVTVNDIPASVPSSFRTYLEAVLDGSTFEVDASHATCFVVRRGVQNQVGCNTIAGWLDQSADGGIDATILAKAVQGDELSYVAKKITVFL